MSDTLHFAMKMIENLSSKDPGKAALAAVDLHRSEQFRTDLMQVALPALTAAYADFKVREEGRAAPAEKQHELDAKRVETEAVRAATARVEAEAEAEKTRAMARMFGASEYRLTAVLEEEVERRVKMAARPSNGAYHAEDHLDG